MVASVRPWKAPSKVMMRKRSGWPLADMILARHLDGGLVGLGARIGEEHDVGEGRLDEPLAPAARLPGCGRGSTCARACRPARSAPRRDADANSRARRPRCRRRNRDSARPSVVVSQTPSPRSKLEVGARIGGKDGRRHGTPLLLRSGKPSARRGHAGSQPCGNTAADRQDPANRMPPPRRHRATYGSAPQVKFDRRRRGDRAAAASESQ